MELKLPNRKFVKWLKVELNSNSYEDSKTKLLFSSTDNLPDDCKLRGGVYFVSSLPMTVAGKPIRGSIKKIATEFYQKNKNAIKVC